jgi:short-subunit dehydrogenase
VKRAEETFGRIDVLVNNAGYGYFAAIEEGEDEEVRRMFETNFFGLVDMVRRVLPGMRSRRRGHIINISSVAGLLSNPTSGYYSASKFAVNGMSEALEKEVAEHGIRVTLIEPGPTRTYFHGSSSRTTRTPNEAYAATAGARRKQMASNSGKQPGDPDRIAQIVVEVATEANPPLHLVCGKQALERAREKMASLQKDLDTQELRSNSADFAS